MFITHNAEYLISNFDVKLSSQFKTFNDIAQLQQELTKYFDEAMEEGYIEEYAIYITKNDNLVTFTYYRYYSRTFDLNTCSLEYAIETACAEVMENL